VGSHENHQERYELTYTCKRCGRAIETFQWRLRGQTLKQVRVNARKHDLCCHCRARFFNVSVLSQRGVAGT
jgi:hypothetical protein